jgi:hypothetical protein
MVRSYRSQPGSGRVEDAGQLAGFETRKELPCQLALEEEEETDPPLGVAAQTMEGARARPDATAAARQTRLIM